LFYRFSGEEVEMLLGLALANAVEFAASYDSDRTSEAFALNRADFLTACRIVAELHAPSHDPIAPPPMLHGTEFERGANPMGLSIDDDMRDAASAEGVDVYRELSGFDERANDPKCVHGRKRSQECQDCASTEGAYAHKIDPETQAALDAALLERRRELGEVPAEPGAGLAAMALPTAVLTEGWLKPLWSAGDGRCNWLHEATEFRCVGDERHPGSHMLTAPAELQRVPESLTQAREVEITLNAGNGEFERVRSVMHRDSCPVSHEHFQPVIGGPSQCTCDFGQRLAVEIGIPHG
jgi:hypothetical protein